jgi:hypothetical protein
MKIPTPAFQLSALLFAFLVSLSPVAATSHGSPEVALAQAASAPLVLGPVASAAPNAPVEPLVLASADLGYSGRLRAIMGTPETLEQNPVLKPLLSSDETVGASSWPTVSTAEGDSITVVTLVPIADADQAGYGRYHVGSWPHDAMTATARYTPPSGFIGVTEQNQCTKLSQSFAVRDFLTHDQGNVWPKVLVLQPRILDKLELLRAELTREGLPSRLHVMSGFRTPQYNAQGVGKGGRATHSRHTYGDAADVFVDADGNGWMDDLNGDGKVDVEDARVLRDAAERVEAEYPTLVGGLSAYPSNGVHGPFVHVDARGVKARW